MQKTESLLDENEAGKGPITAGAFFLKRCKEDVSLALEGIRAQI
jgi:hypothetical protein